jgi:GntR family transcriptional regulator, transcriptional repressor for pyruvate dehydrogenase complex
MTEMSSTGAKNAAYTLLSTVSRTQQVREQLESAIDSGHYKPGDRLPSERELVELLGVSRVSVREAIRSMEAVGRVRVVHGRGCFVATSRRDQYATSFGHWLQVHGDEIFELLKVRGALDELAAESAAADADGEWVARLRELNEAFRATDPTDVDALVAGDVAFHDAVAEASGSALLADLLRELHEIFNESRQATLQPRGRPAQSAKEHDAIIRAIERSDPRAARNAVAKHLEAVRASLSALLDENQQTETSA